MSLIYLALIIIESYLASLYAIPPDLAGLFQYQSSNDAKESMVIWVAMAKKLCLWTLAAGCILICMYSCAV